MRTTFLERKNRGEEENFKEENDEEVKNSEADTKIDSNGPAEEVILMKLSDYKKDYYEFSGKASDVARMATFAGIALIWVFKMDGEAVPCLPSELVLPAGLFALALAADLLHYVVATVTWGVFHRWRERKLEDPNKDPETSHPSCLEYPIVSLFVLKFIFTVTGYVFVMLYIARVWLE